MNRRGFFSALTTTVAGMAAAFTLDPEELLWKPNEKKIFIPTMTYVEHQAINANGHIHDRNCLFIKHWQMMMDLGLSPAQELGFSNTKTLRPATPQELDKVRGIVIPGTDLSQLNANSECVSKNKINKHNPQDAHYLTMQFKNAGIVIPGFIFNAEEQKLI